MPRYIDADLLKKCVQDNITRFYTCGTGGYCLAEDVVEDIDSFPTADVAPRAEVEKMIAEIKDSTFHYYDADIDEIKKKCTEVGE